MGAVKKQFESKYGKSFTIDAIENRKQTVHFKVNILLKYVYII